MGHKKLIFTIVLLLIASSVGANMMFFAPDAEIMIAHNAITTVGIGETVSLVANENDTTITAYDWTLTGPAGSTADLDTATIQSPKFVPDVEGVYNVTATVTDADGTSDPAELTIYAGSYVGVGTIDSKTADYATGQCGYACHSDKVALWETTEHADAFEVKLDTYWDGSTYCLKCHTVGGFTSDTTTSNGGFLDVMASDGWTMPDTAVAGNWDSMAVNFPDVVQMANIQCESCHGPGSGHKGQTGDSRISTNIEENGCAHCHEGGHQYDGWTNSEHGNNNNEFRMYTFGSCVECHTGAGYINKMDEDYNGNLKGGTIVGCATCHDPHVEEANNLHQLRGFEDVVLNDAAATTITTEDAGNGAMCMNCHKAHNDPISDVKSRSHVGPHHAPHADMLYGVNGIEFGVEVKSSIVHISVDNTCAGCHMVAPRSTRSSTYVADVQGDFKDATLTSDQVSELTANAYGHSMYNTFTDDDGNTFDNMSPCATCHPSDGSFDEISMFKKDHDGDGTVEGFQLEIQGMMHALEVRIIASVDGAVDMDDVEDAEKTMPMNVLMALYNWAMIEEDKSWGVHNPQYTLTLLGSANALLDAGAMAGNDDVDIIDVPNDQGKQVRVMWKMFTGDPDILKTYAIWRKIDDASAKASGKEIVTVTDFSDMYRQVKFAEGKLFKTSEATYDFVDEVPASGMAYYAAIAPTVYDSTATGGQHLTYFSVSGHSDTYATVYSADAAGYSMDNLVPVTPGGLMATAARMNVHLEWDDAEDADFQYFAIYRGETPNFTVGAGNKVGTSPEAKFSDFDVPTIKTYYYKVTAFDFSGNESAASDEISAIVTSVESDMMPDEFGLKQNYPNPFNPTTNIQYQLPAAAQVKLVIYNVLGQEIKTIVNSFQSAGFKTLKWNATDNRGIQVAPGVYIYRLTAGSFNKTMKMILLK